MSKLSIYQNSAPALKVSLSNIGPPGLSAYQLAVKNGFSGAELEWLSYISTGARELPQSTLIQVVINASKDITTYTVSGITIPTKWYLHLNGVMLLNSIDYTYTGDSTSIQITFLPALGYSFSNSDVLTFTN